MFGDLTVQFLDHLCGRR